MLEFKLNDVAYVVRKTTNGTYGVCKFEDSNVPSTVYSVRDTRKGLTCSNYFCKKSKCKHVKIVQAWLKARHVEHDLDLVFHEDGTLYKRSQL